MDVTGYTQGLKPSQKKALERTFRRKVPANQILSVSLAQHLAWISREIGRQVGVFIDRRGVIVSVFVGDADRIYLPDIGRSRAGQGQLRGIRHIHTTLQESALQSEDIADLTKLRLDMVLTLESTASGLPGSIQYAYLQKSSRAGVQGLGHRRQNAESIHGLDDDFNGLIQSIEQELGAAAVAIDITDPRPPALLLGVYPDRKTSVWRMAEIEELAQTAGVRICERSTQLRAKPDARYVVGKGKLEEAVLKALEYDADLIIIDHPLSPTQARAIAAFSELKVIDRNQLILDIFAQRAQSRDGKLQVELAQLKYNLPRLTDLDAGMSRLTGGIGGRGPGETKLEINRRRARDKIVKLERQIEKLANQRQLRRQKRQQSQMPVISIVGYTNAGKSTLLNTLTQSNVESADKLFATLDPSSRRLRFPFEQEAIITDTVGFIRELPDDLVNAFRATLEELESAHLLLHVCDVSDPMLDEKKEAVERLLKDLSLEHIPCLLVLNKYDCIDAEQRWKVQAKAKQLHAHLTSATTSEGLSDLIHTIAERLELTPSNPVMATDAFIQEHH